ncbi:MAG: hypothetical protein A2445_00245 [Candidatus Jacksonbacteria bacterium RIFOXYC2_FULL_44_29]|nr:MAG: hypothetical protein UV19_C0006G0027 [Parcubacteria group bacterium GW2011_GWA2_42_28]KKT54722.1 MAG: hypothetical protein UW45_C0012G0027 [Parcubacteria group bacterium GW2011_GWC2_44_22]OGY75320.1 MAG: hypothetical protein A2240_01755 [Candidatus Jacksonbacteria bacterium RIFOXYA2_FULL_43_12]OGY76230.1 MAG: hypothetical protein A2295_05840 [Candidatus Jacksonbacteria bacterium RIFOXYB2_FULL_44_15]OGY78085.1 MAG: hypothetical protein A2445_00245 [Candidatus Jacksonbacteria bacterium RI
MHESLLQTIGLTSDQIVIYETLLKIGALKARDLTLKTPYKRALVYKLLDDLVKLGLAEKETKPGQVTTFRSTHPSALAALLEERQGQLKNVEKTLTSSLPGLISAFNLISGRPGIRFFEGVEGLKQVYLDTLVNTEMIYALLTPAEIEPNLKKWLDATYIKARVKAGIKAQVIAPMSKETVNYHQLDEKSLRETLVISGEDYPVAVEVNIYGQNKVAFISYRADELIGVILESPHIYNTMKTFFKLAWAQATTGARACPPEADAPWVQKANSTKSS